MNTPTEQPILPCPLCGDSPESHDDYNRDVMASAWRVECRRCGLIVEKRDHRGPGGNKTVALAMWERIASGPPAPIVFYTEEDEDRFVEQSLAAFDRILAKRTAAREERG